MGTSQALEVLIREWPSIRRDLRPGTLARIEEEIALLNRHSIPAWAVEEATDLCLRIARQLPADHPFRRALARDDSRFVPASRDPVELSRWLDTVASLRALVPGARRAPTIDEVAKEATAWLLAAPALDEKGLRRLGEVPGDPALIRLEDHSGNGRWPAFQFGEHTALVRRINEILDAADDPWGAADWWLGGHAWFGRAPAELLGEIADGSLIDAAYAERAEV